MAKPKSLSRNQRSGKRPAQTRTRRPAQPEDDGVVELFGVHAMEAALRNPKRKFRDIFLTENMAQKLSPSLRSRRLTPTIVSVRELDKKLGPNMVHQGGLLRAEPLAVPDLNDLPGNALLVALDQVTDPHNVGAVLRSCAVFGAAGLIVTKRNSPRPSAVLAKAASGAVEHVPLIPVTNLARELQHLGDAGYLRVGLEGSAEKTLEDLVAADLLPDMPAVIVLGAEGKGLRRLTIEGCDQLCHIKAHGPIRSLNVSNAAAVALHTVSAARQRRTL